MFAERLFFKIPSVKMWIKMQRVSGWAPMASSGQIVVNYRFFVNTIGFNFLERELIYIYDIL